MSNLIATAKRTGKRVAFLIGEDGPSCPSVLGGKGAGLNELARENVPVPPAFTITTAVHRAFSQHGRLPVRFERQVRWQMAAMEKQTGRRFGDSHRPLLVSVRSGAAISMPGMMDTILNLGMTTRVVVRLAKTDGEMFAWQCYERFLRMFGTLVLGMSEETFDGAVVFTPDGVIGNPPKAIEREFLCQAYRYVIAQHLAECGKTAEVLDNAWLQLEMAVVAVLRSWDSERAVVFRNHHKIPHTLGTAVNVQMMVFGNRDEQSGTGVAFSCNVNTGEPGATGEFLPKAQGEDLVAGTTTPMTLDALMDWNPAVYAELVDVLELMAARRGKPVEIEFTVESGKLYVLQVRAAKLSVLAVMSQAVHDVWAKKATKAEAVSRVTPDNIEAVRTNNFDPEEIEAHKWDAIKGIAASPGAAVGKVVTTAADAVLASNRGEHVILVTDDTKPADLPGMMAAVAIVTRNGGYTCHAAVVARDLGKPAVVGCGLDARYIRRGQTISVDGTRGLVIQDTLKLAPQNHRKEVNLFLKWVRQLRPEGRLAIHTYGERYCLHGILSDFYLADVLANAAKGTRLQEEAATVRERVHVGIAERVAMYLTSAVAGELRHADLKFPKVREETRRLQDAYGVPFGESEARNGQDKVMVKLREMPHAKHVEFLMLATKVFELGWEPDFRGKFYCGGLPWAHIAEWTCKFLTGEQSHYGFTDHAFDLEHNNGTTFGKNDMLDFEREELRRLLTIKKNMSAVPAKARRQLKSSMVRGKRDDAVEKLYEKGVQLGIWRDPEQSVRTQGLRRVHPGPGYIGYDMYEHNPEFITTSDGVYAKKGSEHGKYGNAFWDGGHKSFHDYHLDSFHGHDGGGHKYVTHKEELAMLQSPGMTLGDLLAKAQKAANAAGSKPPKPGLFN